MPLARLRERMELAEHEPCVRNEKRAHRRDESLDVDEVVNDAQIHHDRVECRWVSGRRRPEIPDDVVERYADLGRQLAGVARVGLGHVEHRDPGAEQRERRRDPTVRAERNGDDHAVGVADGRQHAAQRRSRIGAKGGGRLRRGAVTDDPGPVGVRLPGVPVALDRPLVTHPASVLPRAGSARREPAITSTRLSNPSESPVATLSSRHRPS